MRSMNETETQKLDDTLRLEVEDFKIKVIWYLVEEQLVPFVLLFRSISALF